MGELNDLDELDAMSELGSQDDSVELIENIEMPEISETIRDARRVFEGRLLKIDEVDVEFPNGHVGTHEVIRHPGAVAILALDKTGKVLLVRQYRTALERIVVEVPAGKIDPGETPEEAVHRELSEETGYQCGEIRRLCSIAVAVGYSDEIIHIFMATDVTPGEAHPDEDEFLVSEWVEIEAFVESVLDGRIEDSKTVIAALILDSLSHRLKEW